MNRLWIRTQYLSPKDKNRHKTDRKELSVVVSENIVRLSSLESVNVEVYQSLVLPRLLALVHNCKDSYSQQHIMDCIIQVFPYEYHVRTVSYILDTCSGLHNTVDAGAIFISLMERLSSFFNLSKEVVEINKKVDIFVPSKQFIDRITKEGLKISPLSKFIELNIAFIKVCVLCYPDKLQHIETIFDMSVNFLEKQVKVEDDSLKALYKLLTIPLESLSLSVITMPKFIVLVEYLNEALKEELAKDLLMGLVKSRKKINSIETIEKVISFIKPLLEHHFASQQEFFDIQINISKLMHMVDVENCEKEFLCLMKIREFINKGELTRKAIPALIWTLYKLASKASNSASKSQAFQLDVFETAFGLCEVLAMKDKEEAFKLLLQGVTSLDLLGLEGIISAKFMSKAFSLHQTLNLSSITLMIGSLERVKMFTKGQREEFIKEVFRLCTNLKDNEEKSKALLLYTHLVHSQPDVTHIITLGT